MQADFDRSERDLLDLVGEFYDCSIEPAKWPTALSGLASVMCASDVVLTLNNLLRPSFSTLAKWNLDEGFEAAMSRNYAQNPLLHLAWYKSVDEPISLLSEIDEQEVKETDWYSKTYGAFGYRDSAFSILAKTTDQFGSVSFQRKIHQDPFDKSDLDLLSRLSPHIRRAVMIGDLLETKAVERGALDAALNALRVSVILTSANGRIAYANTAAEMLLSKSVVRSELGRLSAQDTASDSELEKAINAAASGTTVDLPAGGVVVSLKASEGGGNLAAWVLPLDGGLRREIATTFSASVAIFLKEVGDQAPVPAELFVKQYGVTPAECRLLLLLVQGLTLARAADTLGVSITTVQTHLGRLMAKTHTSRQIDLVRLAMSVLAPTSASI